MSGPTIEEIVVFKIGAAAYPPDRLVMRPETWRALQPALSLLQWRLSHKRIANRRRKGAKP